MKVSELEKELKQFKDLYGDLEITFGACLEQVNWKYVRRLNLDLTYNSIFKELDITVIE